jgi:hypothetical protein
VRRGLLVFHNHE